MSETENAEVAPDVAVQTVSITRQYKRGSITVPALNGIDLTVRKGEIVGIIGPSGSGKTTLLNMVGGLDRPSHGKVLIDNVDLSTFNDDQLSDYRLHKVGFIFQFYNLIPTMTALENVEVPMNLAKMPKVEREQRAHELLKLVGLDSRTDHLPAELSGGEQQRVAVARALANNPSVILGDEPTGDLRFQIGRGADGPARLVAEGKEDRVHPGNSRPPRCRGVRPRLFDKGRKGDPNTGQSREPEDSGRRKDDAEQTVLGLSSSS